MHAGNALCGRQPASFRSALTSFYFAEPMSVLSACSHSCTLLGLHNSSPSTSTDAIRSHAGSSFFSRLPMCFLAANTIDGVLPRCASLWKGCVRRLLRSAFARLCSGTEAFVNVVLTLCRRAST